MVGIKDVARESGFPVTTVSYALSGKRKISEWKVERIRAVAKQLNYAPNIFASNLKSAKTNIVGVYVASFQGEFYGDILDGIEGTLDSFGYGMVVMTGERSRRFLSSDLIDGAIILDATFTDEDLLQYLNDGHKMVILDRELEHENARTVLLDNRNGSRLAFDYLYHADCDTFAVVTGPGNFDSVERLASFRECSEEKDIHFTQFAGDFGRDSGYALGPSIAAMIESGHHLGVYFFNDEMAIGFYGYARDNDIDLTEGFTAVGFDMTHAFQLASPRFASIGYHKHRWGKLAATSIVNLVQGREQENLRVATSLDGEF